MSYILFAVEIPPLPPNSHGSLENPEWSAFAHEMKSKLSNWRGSKQNLSSVWIGPAEGSMPFLADACAEAGKRSLKYTILLLAGEITSLSKP